MPNQKSSYATPLALAAANVDLPAGVETELLGANGIDVSQSEEVIIQVDNLNVGQPIDVLSLYERAPNAAKWMKMTKSVIAAIAASGSSIIKVRRHSHGQIRLTATPVAHVSASVTASLLQAVTQ